MTSGGFAHCAPFGLGGICTNFTGSEGTFYRDGQVLYLDVFPNRFGLTTVILSQRDEPTQPALVIADTQNIQ